MFSFIIVGIVMVSFQSKKKKKKSKTEVGTRGWGISVIDPERNCLKTR